MKRSIHTNDSELQNQKPKLQEDTYGGLITLPVDILFKTFDTIMTFYSVEDENANAFLPCIYIIALKFTCKHIHKLCHSYICARYPDPASNLKWLDSYVPIGIWVEWQPVPNSGCNVICSAENLTLTKSCVCGYWPLNEYEDTRILWEDIDKHDTHHKTFIQNKRKQMSKTFVWFLEVNEAEVPPIEIDNTKPWVDEIEIDWIAFVNYSKTKDFTAIMVSLVQVACSWINDFPFLAIFQGASENGHLELMNWVLRNTTDENAFNQHELPIDIIRGIIITVIKRDDITVLDRLFGELKTVQNITESFVYPSGHQTLQVSSRTGNYPEDRIKVSTFVSLEDDLFFAAIRHKAHKTIDYMKKRGLFSLPYCDTIHKTKWVQLARTTYPTHMIELEQKIDFNNL